MPKMFQLNGESVKPGERKTIEIHISRLADHTEMSITAHVIRGKRDGPVLFVSAAVHGDEIIGVEVIRRLVGLRALNRLRGTLILVPIVNAYGFIALSRYLPDRRDLNRSFPGSETGSLAAQLANKFMTEIVAPAQYGIDLHSAAVHRDNLPQIRADLDDPEVNAMATAFGASIMLNATLRDGSLRSCADDNGCKILLFEAGEALRFNEVAVRVGLTGIIGVLRHVGMLAASKKSARSKAAPIRSDSSHWLRAPMGGVMRATKKLGDTVKKGETIAIVADPLGFVEQAVTARSSGIVIGRANLPVVNRGDALFHIARVASLSDAEETMNEFGQALEDDPLFDGFAIV
jgi:uncharacterized protein